jgi:hypothetical protein
MPGGGGGKGGGGSTSTVNVNNGPVTVDADSTVEVVGLDHINVTTRLEPTPLKMEGKQELILPQPLKTESKLDTKSDVTSDSKSAMSVDLKPVAMDVCLNTSSKLPQGQIHQPFTSHVGLTWFGVEFFGVNYGGESRTVLQDLPKKPWIEGPQQQNAAPPAPSPPRGDDSFPAARDRGLRVRIK